MTTPILILCLLLLPLLVATVIRGRSSARLGGTIGMALAFGFFGLGHFVQTEAMTQMLPYVVPFATQLVIATGLLELAVALALLHPASRRSAGLAAIAIFVGFFPVNVFAALNHTGMGGHVWGPSYLLIRAPLQAFLIWWAWFFILRQRGYAPARFQS